MPESTPAVLDELRAIARSKLAMQSPGHTLQPTALVNEVWIKLREYFRADLPPPAFFKMAADAMRQILIDHARTKLRDKRGGGRKREDFDVVGLNQIDESTDPDLLLFLDESIAQLDAADPQAAQVVKLRFFAGLSVEQTARAMEISERTVKRSWQFARAFLLDALQGP
jgi:RNA polymerase sigma-70 factor, ECF subfamily